MSSKANAVYGVPPIQRRVQPPQTLYNDYYAQQIMQQSLHSSLFPAHHPGFGPSPGSAVTPPGLPASVVGGIPLPPMTQTLANSPGQVVPSSHLVNAKREEPDGDLTPQVGQTHPVLFQVGSESVS